MERLAAPSPGNAYSHGWKILKKNFLELLLIIFVVAVVETPMGYFNREVIEFTSYGYEGSGMYNNFYSMLYGLLVVTPFQFGATFLFLKAVRGEKFEIRTIISPFNRFFDVIFAQILVVGIVAIGIVMLIIPGIIFAIRLVFVPYLVMDKGLDAIGAVKASWKMTSGYSWNIFGMGILAFFIFIGGLLFLIVGVFVSIIWVSAAFASLYFAVDTIKNPPKEESEAGSVTIN